VLFVQIGYEFEDGFEVEGICGNEDAVGVEVALL
jgi:hypothetical protein